MAVSIRKQIGSTMIVVGTEIGAGVLALPILTAKLGFLFSIILMVISWITMTYSALLVADINLTMPEGTSFGKMSRNLLGRPGEVVSWLSFLFLLYAIIVAYISAASSAFSFLLPMLNQQWFAVIFVSVLGFCVLKGIGAVDVINRYLLSVKLVFFLLVCLTFFAYIHPVNLLASNLNQGIILLALPVIISSFTSHIIVPSLRTYLESDAKALFRVLVIGSTIPLILYVLWEVCLLGTIPLTGPHSFMEAVFAHKSVTEANIADILAVVSNKINSPYVRFSINAFSDISVMTSFLGVAMSLYHFLIDSIGLRNKSNLYKISVAGTLTLVIPLVIVLLNPNLFVRVMGYVGVSIAVLVIIMPVLMVRKLCAKNIQLHYRISSMKIMWFIIFLVGCLVIVFELFGSSS